MIFFEAYASIGVAYRYGLYTYGTGYCRVFMYVLMVHAVGTISVGIISTDPDPDPNPDPHSKTADQYPRPDTACLKQDSAYCKYKVVQFFVDNIHISLEKLKNSAFFFYT
jgi:hypothetical protein